MCCPSRQKKISLCLTVHAQWILCLHHLWSVRFCHFHCSSVHREIVVQRPGIWGEGEAAGSLWGAGKGGEVQSGFAHTRFLLALLVQSQTRWGTMSKQYHVGPERRDTKSERDLERKRCKSSLPTRGELVQQGLSPAPRAECTSAVGKGQKLEHSQNWWSAPWALRAPDPPLSPLQGWPFPHGTVPGCSGDVPVQCSPWQRACPVLHPHTGFPLGTETDPEWKHFVILYILEDLSFNNFVLNMVLFISIHDLWISNEHALWSTNLHGNSYKSGGKKCTLCL